MKIPLAENIKRFRKERKLTQEQLAEALDVSIGAVSKSESSLSVPDITLIIELANFFETSLDVLIGYDWKQGYLGKTIEEIKSYRRKKLFDQGIKEVDKALTKYPNQFELVYESAIFYALAGVEQKSDKAYERSLELHQRALELLSQNNNPDISDISIKNDMAGIYIALKKHDKAIELLKQNNVCGINNTIIGYSLSQKPETSVEALTYLSNGFLQFIVNDALKMTLGYSNAYYHLHRINDSIYALEWYISLMQNSRKSAEITYLDKLEGLCLATLAKLYAETNDIEKARTSLRRSMMLGKRFDSSPRYSMDGIYFYHGTGTEIAYDDFGESSLNEFYHLATSEPKTADIIKKLWEELNNEEK